MRGDEADLMKEFYREDDWPRRRVRLDQWRRDYEQEGYANEGKANQGTALSSYSSSSGDTGRQGAHKARRDNAYCGNHFPTLVKAVKDWANPAVKHR
jgi:hypothetical protein